MFQGGRRLDLRTGRERPWRVSHNLSVPIPVSQNQSVDRAYKSKSSIMRPTHKPRNRSLQLLLIRCLLDSSKTPTLNITVSLTRGSW